MEKDIELNMNELHKQDSDSLSTGSSHKDYNKNQTISKDEKKQYLNVLYERFDLKKKQHALSAEYYHKLHYSISIPSILFGTAISILSFMNSSVVIDEGESSWIDIGIGITSSITTLANTFSNTFNFKTRAEAHHNSAKSYSKLLTEIQGELIMMNDSQFLNYLEEQELKIKGDNNYLIPSWIENKH